jgi:NAD(P)-dependent dehydrogenase (short-subunit alcohol dehydrogenase family)
VREGIVAAAMAELSGKVAVVTGGGSGIGRSTALLLARLGAKVYVTDLDAERAAAVASEIAASGGIGAPRELDVTDADAVQALAAAVFEAEGAVDILHNNAGIGHTGYVEETTLDDWRRVIEVNLMGTIHGVHAFVPRMLKQERPAHIVNTASMAGLVASAELAPYTTSKFAVVGMSEAMNAELAPKGIHVTAVCPGLIDTDIVHAATYRGELARDAERVQDFYHRRGASPDVVARAVVRALRRKPVIQPVPYSHVMVPWIVKRISPRAAQALARAAPRLARR